MGDMRTEVTIDTRRLWGAGIATAAVAALAGAVVFMFAEGVFDVGLRVRVGGRMQELTIWSVLIVGFIAGVVATAVLHLFLRFVPRPTLFFGWLAVLALAASLLAPLTLPVRPEVKYWLCGMHVAVGVVIIALLLGIAPRVRVERAVRFAAGDPTRRI
ncbi:MAG: DUF6069 family protein [Actinomycetota bacterium]